MKESFYASICADGLNGGAAYLDDEGFLFRCQKLTIEKEYRNLRILYKDVKSVRAGKRILFFPTTIIETDKGKSYCFLIFNRKKFMKCIVKFVLKISD